MDERWEKVAALDLKSVREKFSFNQSLWWNLRNNALRVEHEYRQYLYLIVTNPDRTVVPWSRDVDNFWHQHILDTRKYAEDCTAILGRFIHHNPHLPEGSMPHLKASQDTRKMYIAAFGEAVKRRDASMNFGCDMPVVFCASSTSAGHHHSGGHHGGGHHAGGDGGSGGHGCGGHGCGGHGGH